MKGQAVSILRFQGEAENKKSGKREKRKGDIEGERMKSERKVKQTLLLSLARMRL